MDKTKSKLVDGESDLTTLDVEDAKDKLNGKQALDTVDELMTGQSTISSTSFPQRLSLQETQNQWYSTSLQFEAPTIDEIIRHCIDKIWIQYDDDGNGYLDREETKAFIRDSLKGEDA